MELIDAHLHLWDFGRAEYPWLRPGAQHRYGSLAPDVTSRAAVCRLVKQFLTVNCRLL